ncbi:hypothetical protein LR013_06070 [candidate division NPL-UPA2 bacterium]|nr:hypothetical protein [candidate division NPL-UPA2 bacterium]
MLREDKQIDAIFMFVLRNLRSIFVGISLAILVGGIVWFFIPGKIIRWLERIPRSRLRLMGLAEIILSLGLLYFVLYR